MKAYFVAYLMASQALISAGIIYLQVKYNKKWEYAVASQQLALAVILILVALVYMVMDK